MEEPVCSTTLHTPGMECLALHYGSDITPALDKEAWHPPLLPTLIAQSALETGVGCLQPAPFFAHRPSVSNNDRTLIFNKDPFGYL